jgi:riboflavin biosynthesis pyrimidine reductase
MATNVLKLFPGPMAEVALRGSYLAHEINRLGTPAKPFVYGSFLSSLDGRIALEDGENGRSHVPAQITSSNDFRLLLELVAQADCLVTNGHYMRAIAERRLDDILQVGKKADHADLALWRKQQGLSAQPAVVIASGSLDFSIPPSLAAHGQQVYIATGRLADRARVEQFERQGYRVIVAGEGKQVEGAALAMALGVLGFQSLYLLAGPKMLETMLRQRVLSRLYLTITHQIIGGEKFLTMIGGSELNEQGRLQLQALYYDASAPQGAGQWFAQFEPHAQ